MLSPYGRNDNRSQTGTGVVAPTSPETQWYLTGCETSRSGDRDGCIISGMGGNTESHRPENRRVVVNRRTSDAHKLS